MEKETKNKLVRVIATAVLLIAFKIIEKSTNLSVLQLFFLYLIPYLIVGFDVLKEAGEGIAMGAMGSDAAVEAADVVLMDDQPSKIAKAVKISRRTLSIAKQNAVFAIIVKLLVWVLAGFGLAAMWMAVFADVGVTVLAVLNATRALSTNY